MTNTTATFLKWGLVIGYRLFSPMELDKAKEPDILKACRMAMKK